MIGDPQILYSAYLYWFVLLGPENPEPIPSQRARQVLGLWDLNLLSIWDLYGMKIQLFLKKSMFIFLIISKKFKLKKSSEVKFGSSIFNSSYIFE